jgi:hypothetical protein
VYLLGKLKAQIPGRNKTKLEMGREGDNIFTIPEVLSQSLGSSKTL